MSCTKMHEAINEQIKHEFGSAYLYMSMAAYFEELGLQGMAHWMKIQAKEEVNHAMKFFGHLADRGLRIELYALEKPQKEWVSPLAAFQAAYEHEKFITAKIHNLMSIANKESDFAALPLLHWFEDEQIEEEASAKYIADTLEKIKDSANGLIMLDRELAKRGSQ